MSTLSNKNIAEAIYLSLKESSDKVALSKVVNFLIKRKLFTKSKNILKELEILENKEKGILKVKIYTAVPLKDDFKKKLSSALLNKYKVKSILFEEKIDKKTLGGIKLEINDEVVDFTILGRLTKLQEHLTI